MQVDYIIVGFGLSGLSISKILEDKGKSFIVIDDCMESASRVAIGIFNPVILKRFTPVRGAEVYLKNLYSFHKDINKRLKKNYFFFSDILSVIKSVKEQDEWLIASDKPILEKYMRPILNEKMKGIIAPYGFGKIEGTGRVLIKELLDDYFNHLMDRKQFLKTSFVHADLEINDENVVYRNIRASRIIFTEGFRLKKNSFFNYLPLTGTKGEMLMIEARGLKLKSQIKSSLFLVHHKGNIYWAGATFDLSDKTPIPTENRKRELIKKLNQIIEVPYKIIHQSAAIRPTVRDRNPLLGRHPHYKNLFVFNGLGAHGIMVSPTMAENLYRYLEIGESLSKEVDIRRFDHYWKAQG